MKPLQTVLFATDFSPHAALAFPLACSLARQADARLIVLHVARPPVVIYGADGNLLPSPADYRETARQRLAGLATPDPSLKMEYRLGEGEVAAEVLRQARTEGADLIVVGTHGRSGLDRLLIGSVAGDLLRKAPCPVAAVKAPARDALAQWPPQHAPLDQLHRRQVEVRRPGEEEKVGGR